MDRVRALRGEHKDDTRAHYNRASGQTRDERLASTILPVRQHNNYIVSCAVNAAVRSSWLIGGSGGGVTVVDLACGRGGVLTKLRHLDIVQRYEGYDIASERIQEAIRRASTLRLGFSTRFQVVDCSANGGEDEDSEVDIPWNACVLCLFAIHYFTESPAAFDAFLDRLAPASSVCVAMVDQAVLADRLRAGNGHHACEAFEVEACGASSYRFRTADDTVDCVEHVVDEDRLVARLEDHGFVVSINANFRQLLDQYMRHGDSGGHLYRRMCTAGPCVGPCEDLLGMYKFLVLTKS